MNRKNAVHPLEAVDAPKEPPEDRNAPGILAVGDVPSHLKMIVTAVAQAAIAAHRTCLDIRNPCGK